MTTTELPFDDIRNLLRQLPPRDDDAAAAVRRTFARAGGAEGSFGILEEIAPWLAGTTGRVPPQVVKPLVAVFAGTHGVGRHLGSADVTLEARERVERLASGAAPLSHLCHANDLGLNIFDLALDLPVGDITVEAALDERGCAATMAFGMEAVASGTDLLCLAGLQTAMGVPAACVLSALFRDFSSDGLAGGPQAGSLVRSALAVHSDKLDDPLEALRRLGGREISALAGAILAARMQKIPVLLDGLTAIAAAGVLHAIDPDALDHCRLVEAADDLQRQAAGHMGLTPLFDFGIRDGEGAVALAAGIVRSAGRVAAGLAEVEGRTAAD